MPTLFSAKDIAEEALKKIGRFPTSQSQANAVDLTRALRMLELILQASHGEQSMIGGKGTLQVPLVATVRNYPLQYLANPAGVQIVFDAELLEVASGSVTPLKVLEEEEFFKRNLTDTGLPCEIYVNKGPEATPSMQIHPYLGPDVASGLYKIYLQIQTFATTISERNIGSRTINIRPTFYLWAITKLAYQLGTGTIRRLPRQETDQFKLDYEEMEIKLVGFDGNDNSNQPFTEPWG